MEWHWWAILAIVLVVLNILVIIYAIHRHASRWADTARQEESLRSHGEAAKALVLETRDTGTRFGAYSLILVRLRLQVMPAFGDPFETSIEAKISPVRIPDFAEGKEIAVRIDPSTRTVVVDQRVIN